MLPRRNPAIPGLTPEEMPPLEPVDESDEDHDDSGASGDGQATSP